MMEKKRKRDGEKLWVYMLEARTGKGVVILQSGAHTETAEAMTCA